eukprot:scaffold182198_cov29-Tisochrysis_lutea.AAC.2
MRLDHLKGLGHWAAPRQIGRICSGYFEQASQRWQPSGLRSAPATAPQSMNWSGEETDRASVVAGPSEQ